MANPFKRAIRSHAPKRANRNMFAMGGYNRLIADWVGAYTRSADGDLRADLRTMRSRSRELLYNSPFGVKYGQLMAENIVGPVGRTGFQLLSQNYVKGTERPHESANTAIEDAFLEWARPANSDVRNQLTLGEQLCLAASAWGSDGEMIVRFLRGPRFGPFGLKLQMVDPDLLVDNRDQVGYRNLPTINQGIEQDEYGAAVAYWFWTRHPYDLQGRFMGPGVADVIRVPAADVVHGFIPRRVGQSRGIPHMHAIATTLHMLEGYIEAELVAARIASASMGAIEDLPNGDGPAVNPNASIGTNDDADDGSQGPGGQEIPAEAEPGALLDLRGKGKLTLWDPQHPTSAFPDFRRALSHHIAMGLSVSYGTLTGDLSQANYGSLRVGMLDERAHWERCQTFVAEHVMERVYREFLRAALLNEMIPSITDRDVNRWTRVEWMGRGFDWIDPVKDVQGDIIEVAAGINSLTNIAGRKGRVLERVIQQRRRELDLFERYDVTSTLATTITDRPTNETDPGDTSGGNTDGTTTPSTDANDATSGKALPLRSILQSRPRVAASR